MHSDCYEKIVKELAHYKDLEEQGRLVVLPCKVGDTVYVIPSLTNYLHNKFYDTKSNRIYCQVVTSVEWWTSGYLIKTFNGLCCVQSVTFGETWFLAEAEAQAALDRMEEAIG